MQLKNVYACLLIGGGALMAALPARAVTYWASGSNYEEGWFDFGQQGPTSCGRATSASLIYWWQRESNLKNPVDATVDQIFAKIEGKYSDSGDPSTGGSFVHDCVNWYMGEYYPEVDLKTHFWRSHTFFNPVYGGGHGNAREASELIKDSLSKGLLLAVDTGAHALTLWGAEFDDETGLVSKIWVADPSLETEQNALECFRISDYAKADPDNRWLVFKLADAPSSTDSNMDIRWLYTLTPIPEPSSAFLLGAGAFFLACARRRRRSRGK